MKIETKFNVGDYVYYLDSKQNVNREKIDRIEINVDPLAPNTNIEVENPICIRYKLYNCAAALFQNELFKDFEEFKNSFQQKFNEFPNENHTSNSIMNKIDLGINRAGAHLWFENIKDNIYELKTDKQFVLEHCRIGTTDAEVIMVDPSGGPYINVGEVFGDYKLESIFYEGKSLRFELNLKK